MFPLIGERFGFNGKRKIPSSNKVNPVMWALKKIIINSNMASNDIYDTCMVYFLLFSMLVIKISANRLTFIGNPTTTEFDIKEGF